MIPSSDVDLLILLREEPSETLEAQLSDFLTSLWDLGLEVGHSVRTIEQCVEEATADLTIITNLMESRCIVGNRALFEQLQQQITTNKLWSSTDFFEAKLEEKRQRYRHYGEYYYPQCDRSKGVKDPDVTCLFLW